MKKFFLIILLIINNSFVLADGLSSFKVDGMSIGDSLLDHFSLKEILNSPNYDHLPSDMSYRISDITPISKMSDRYDAYQFMYEPYDQNFTIYGMRGIKICDDTLSCNNQYETIKSNLISLYGNTAFKEDDFVHPDDPNSLVKIISYDFNGGSINASFTNWSSNTTYKDNISIDLYSPEVSYWISNGYTF